MVISASWPAEQPRSPLTVTDSVALLMMVARCAMLATNWRWTGRCSGPKLEVGAAVDAGRERHRLDGGHASVHHVEQIGCCPARDNEDVIAVGAPCASLGIPAGLLKP